MLVSGSSGSTVSRSLASLASLVSGSSGSSELAETATMAGSATAIPTSASVPGRSPRASPAITANAAEPTALSELATLNAACRKPRYKANVPTTSAKPANAPHHSAAGVGACVLTHGTITSSNTMLRPSLSTVTWSTLAAREASPAAKSEAPYPSAETRASAIASTVEVPPEVN